MKEVEVQTTEFIRDCVRFCCKHKRKFIKFVNKQSIKESRGKSNGCK